jgi:NAD(P)-dependent dehydrogenase (short-subunit alcohol dehydrogenase family)
MEQQHAEQRRVALVSGASFGIGAAAALALARDGFDLAVTSREPSRLADTCSKIEAAGARALPVVLDVRSIESIRNAFGRVFDHFGSLDVLVNNAGVPLQKPTIDITPPEWDDVMNTNIDGTFFMSQTFAHRLIAAKRPGLIINITSAHGFVHCRPGRVAYGVSKAAIDHMTRMLAIEWADHGVRVNSIAPGRVDTKSPARAKNATDPKYIEAALSQIPLRRFCSMEDVAEAVRWLASRGADYVTGHTVLLDGGVTIS